MAEFNAGGQQNVDPNKQPFYLAGGTRPCLVYNEFPVDRCKPAQVVSSEHKGIVQFGQPEERPTISKEDWTNFDAGNDGHAGTDRDQTDSVETETSCHLYLVQNGWKVQRGKVCIQADTLLCRGDRLDPKEWGDKITFSLLQTLESSTPTFTYQDPDDYHKLYTVTTRLKGDVCYPLLDLDTFIGSKYLPRSQRPWAPYYSAVSHINLTGLVETIETSEKKALSGCISLGDSPYVLIPKELLIGPSSTSPLASSASTSANEHCQLNSSVSATKHCKLITAEHEEKYRSWIVVHDQSTSTVWPMVMFEWYFYFKACVKGNSLIFDASTPYRPTSPTIFLDGDPDFKGIPQFPCKVLNKVGPCNNEYIAANDQGLYKWVLVNDTLSN